MSKHQNKEGIKLGVRYLRTGSQLVPFDLLFQLAWTRRESLFHFAPCSLSVSWERGRSLGFGGPCPSQGRRQAECQRYFPHDAPMTPGLLPRPVFPATHCPELHQGCWPQSGRTWICLGPWSQNVWLMKADPWWIVRSHYLPAPSPLCW